jgi:single-stranded-DNA-specific exonuclease
MPIWKFHHSSYSYPACSLVDAVLANRGVSKEQLVSGEVESPFALTGMEEVSRRLARAASQGERVLVFGDYDCDGVCSTFIMTDFLNRCGAKAVPQLPTRQDGYGIKPEQVRQAAANGFDLIVTVDNGISALHSAAAAREAGIDLLLTDHHEPLMELPDVPLVDPKLPGGNSYRDYSGAGVAYLTCCAVAELLQVQGPEDYLDLVSLATVVDICPINGQNFILARRGLLQLRERPRPGIAALLKLSNTDRIDGQVMGWMLGPRINAAGRLADPILAYRLISAVTEGEADLIGQELETIRKASQEAVKVTTAACLKLYDGAEFPIFSSEEWNEGIVGVAAGRLVGNLQRPAAVGCRSGEVIKFSARSVGQFNLVKALNECQSRTRSLLSFGGHQGAAGFTLEVGQLAVVKQTLNEIAASLLQPEDIVEWIEIDARLEALPSLQDVADLDLLEPYGHRNPKPTFYIKDYVADVKCGRNWTLVRTASGLKFFTSQGVRQGDLLHVALSLSIDEYNGYRSIIGNAEDVRSQIYARDDLLKRYVAWRRDQRVPDWAEAIFNELGLERCGDNGKTSLYKSPTFLKYGFVKS